MRGLWCDVFEELNEHVGYSGVAKPLAVRGHHVPGRVRCARACEDLFVGSFKFVWAARKPGGLYKLV